MRNNVRRIVEEVAKLKLASEPVVEFGAYQVEGQAEYADLRRYFPGQKYIGCDMRAGLGVDQVEDLEQGTSFGDNSVGTVITCDTFEHVYDIFAAARELHRITVEGGYVLMVSVMYFPIHSHPYDYWRFTPYCLTRLFKNFTDHVLIVQGDPEFPHTVGILARKGATIPPVVRQTIEGLSGRLANEAEGCGWLTQRERSYRKLTAPLRKARRLPAKLYRAINRAKA